MTKRRKTKTASADATGAAKLYCHCQLPYDDSRVMIACDVCDQWYHYDCVGITKRDASRVKHFMCRNCQADGFLGSAGENWYIEPEVATAAVATDKKKELPTTAAQKQRKRPQEHTKKRVAATAATKQQTAAAVATQPKKKMGGPRTPADVALTGIRAKVRDKLADALAVDVDAGVAEHESAQPFKTLAGGIEDALVDICGGTTSDYKTRARNLSFNVSDPLNGTLRQSLLTGIISPAQLVRMSNAEMANEQAKLAREAIEKEKVEESLHVKLDVDQAEMDRDGTVHWVPVEESRKPSTQPAEEEHHIMVGAETTLSAPAAAPAPPTPLSHSAAAGPTAAVAAPAPLEARHANLALRKQESALIAQIMALPRVQVPADFLPVYDGLLHSRS
jgi:hypothetical protein